MNLDEIDIVEIKFSDKKWYSNVTIQGKQIFISFIDFYKVYVSVVRETAFDTLKEHRMNKKNLLTQ